MYKPIDAEYYNLLQHLQAVQFALVELTLYLDTHPDDLGAVRQFNALSLQRSELARRYETEYGPLLQFGFSMSGEPWNWSQGPWPWQV